MAMQRIARSRSLGARYLLWGDADYPFLLEQMEGAPPALLLFPRFGHASAIRPMGQGETFMRLTQASTNYVALGEAAFAALGQFVDEVPAMAMDFPSGDEAIAMVERLWEERA